MNDLEASIESLKEEIDKQEEIKEYLRLKEIVSNDKELKKMRKDIARLTNDKKFEERNNLLKIYNSHPIIVNYNIAREEVISLLNEIKEELSD